MPIAILTTMADERRPAVTYRIEFETEDKVREWLDTKWFLQERNRIWMLADDAKTKGTNTVVSVFHENGDVEVRQIACRWEQVTVLLEVADDIERDTIQVGSGRRPKRVLVTTTSKERRENKRYLY